MASVRHRNQVLLLALAAAPEHSLTPVQAQKIAFLVSQEAKRLAPKPFYKFVPYDYGPFSSDVYKDLEGLARRGLVSVELPPTVKVRRYRLTPEGKDCVLDIQEESGELSNYVTQATEWVSNLSFPELVSAIYARYPAFKRNSVFVD
jgi:hypothetical protein